MDIFGPVTYPDIDLAQHPPKDGEKGKTMNEAQKSPDFFLRLEAHMADNEQHKRQVSEALASSDFRMALLEGHVKEIKETLTPVDAFMRSLKIISGLAAAIMAMFLWIALQRDADLKSMQATINTHTQQISESIALLRESMRDHEKDINRIERDLERGRK